MSEIVDYVELIYETEETLEQKKKAIHQQLETRKKEVSAIEQWWDGFDWATVRGHIDAAKTKIAQEPTTKPLWSYAPWDWYTDGDMRERDMTELLGELKKLSSVGDM